MSLFTSHHSLFYFSYGTLTRAICCIARSFRKSKIKIMRKQSQKILTGWPARFSLRNTAKTTPIMRSKSARAMTLIEVMRALMVLALVFGGVISSMVRAASLTRDAKVIYRETAIVNDLVERMRSMTFKELKDELADATKNKGTVGVGNEKVLAGAYTYKLKQESNVGEDPIRISLTIHPENQPHRSISVVTYISSAGLINKDKK